MPVDNLGEILKREIQAARPRIKMQEIADLLGISYQRLYEKFRKNTFSDEDLDKIAKRLGVAHNHYFAYPDGTKVDFIKKAKEG